MRALATPIALALTFALPVLARAAAPGHDVGRRDVWKPGDVVTTTTKEDRYREIRVPDKEEETGPSKPQRLRSVVVALERCEETDLEGNRTRALVYFDTWSFDNGATKDESLKGALVDVTGRGKERTWKLVGARTAPSKPALAWLAREVGASRPDDDTARRAWLPKVPVAVGDEWPAELAVLLDGMTGADKLDRTRATATSRLEAVEGGVAKMTLAAKLPLTSFPTAKSAKPVAWSKGGAYAWKGSLTVALEGRVPATRLATAGTLEGEAVVEGKTVAILVKVDRTSERALGGTFPDPATVPPYPPVEGAPAPTPAPPAMGETPPK